MNDPIPTSNAAHALKVFLEYFERLHGLILQCIKVDKNSVVKMFIAQFIPNVPLRLIL